MDIMLDLETMGNGSDCAIVAIGAVAFDMKTRTVGESFYCVVDLTSSIKTGGVCDGSTIMWWMEQSEEARAALTRQKGVHLAQALASFAVWYDRVAGTEGDVWGNGATADNVWLSNAYRRLELRRPWSYKQDRCYRTVRALFPQVEREPYGTAHNALDDAMGQALHLIKLLGPVMSVEQTGETK